MSALDAMETAPFCFEEVQQWPFRGFWAKLTPRKSLERDFFECLLITRLSFPKVSLVNKMLGIVVTNNGKAAEVKYWELHKSHNSNRKRYLKLNDSGHLEFFGNHQCQMQGSFWQAKGMQKPRIELPNFYSTRRKRSKSNKRKWMDSG